MRYLYGMFFEIYAHFKLFLINFMFFSLFLVPYLISFPLISLTQLVQYSVVCHVADLTHGELRGRHSGITGHSQGIVSAVVMQHQAPLTLDHSLHRHLLYTPLMSPPRHLHTVTRSSCTTCLPLHPHSMAVQNVRRRTHLKTQDNLRQGLHTHTLSSLNFTQNNEAHILPLARGLLYFSFSAPANLIATNQVGEMPAYSTIYNALKGLAAHEATITASCASDPTKMGFPSI